MVRFLYSFLRISYINMPAICHIFLHTLYYQWYHWPVYLLMSCLVSFSNMQWNGSLLFGEQIYHLNYYNSLFYPFQVYYLIMWSNYINVQGQFVSCDKNIMKYKLVTKRKNDENFPERQFVPCRKMQTGSNI